MNRATRPEFESATARCPLGGRSDRERPRQDSRPSAHALHDPLGRRLDYLRLSVTDRCNLRCHYCQPPGGARILPREAVLSWEELLRLSAIFIGLGVRKIRVTGGEPFVRPGLVGFLRRLRDLATPPSVTDAGPGDASQDRRPAATRLHITTNGTRLREHLDALQELGLKRLNISLDSLRRETFARITGRDAFARVWDAVLAADAAGFGIKLNVVVLRGVNEHEIEDFVALTQERAWTVRFIEAMPFDGLGGDAAARVTGEAIGRHLARRYALVPVLGEPTSVDVTYRIPGHRGRVGIIAAYSRPFCGRCSRWRVNVRGELRTCLYGTPVLDLRRRLRDGSEDAAIAAALRAAARDRHANGHAAEAAAGCLPPDSMSQIGG